MSRAWGHKIRKLTIDEVADIEERGRRHREQFPDSSWDERKCRAAPKCRERAAYLIEYSYVTGRAGRTSYAQKMVCEHHGNRFMAKHGIEPGDVGERVNEAAMRFLSGPA